MDKILDFVDEHLSTGEIEEKCLKVSWATFLFEAMLQFQNLNIKIFLRTKKHH